MRTAVKWHSLGYGFDESTRLMTQRSRQSLHGLKMHRLTTSTSKGFGLPMARFRLPIRNFAYSLESECRMRRRTVSLRLTTSLGIGPRDTNPTGQPGRSTTIHSIRNSSATRWMGASRTTSLGCTPSAFIDALLLRRVPQRNDRQGRGVTADLREEELPPAH